jgi:hypothetical protein
VPRNGPPQPPPSEELPEETRLLLETLKASLKKQTGSDRRAAGLLWGLATGWLLDLGVEPMDMSDHMFTLIREREVV